MAAAPMDMTYNMILTVRLKADANISLMYRNAVET